MSHHERRYVKPDAKHPTWLTCEPCQKRGYHTKAQAKGVARQLDGKMDVYRCPHATDEPVYHVGHQSPHVTAGVADRAELAARRRKSRY